MNTRTKSLLVPAVLVVVVLVFPRLVTSNYWLNLINLAISFSIACLGLNIVLGYAGQLSLAQAAFWGVGAYTSAILTTQLGLPVWAGMFAAFFVAAFFGILLGIPTLKLSGHYLAMATIGFGIILQLILVNAIWLTNGSDGIPKIPSPWIGSFELKDPGTFFYVAAVSLILLTWGAIHLKDSRVGRAFMAIRENEMAAGTAGVDTTYYKIMAFSLSAGYAGFGGWLFAHSGSHYISPDTFSFEQSVIMLVMAVLGGNGSAIGSIVGAILLTLLPEVLRFLKDSYMMVYAAGIVLIMIFMPSGIAGLVKNLPVSARLREWWRDGSTAARQVAAAAATLEESRMQAASCQHCRLFGIGRGAAHSQRAGQALRRPQGGGRSGHGGPTGEDPCPDRAERFREDDDPQHAQRPVCPDGRRNPPGGEGHRRAEVASHHLTGHGPDVPEHPPLRRAQCFGKRPYRPAWSRPVGSADQRSAAALTEGRRSGDAQEGAGDVGLRGPEGEGVCHGQQPALWTAAAA